MRTFTCFIMSNAVVYLCAKPVCVDIGQGFTYPLHSIKESFGRWGFKIENFLIALYCAQYIVNKSTYIRDPATVLQFIEQHSCEIIDG